MRSFFSAGVSEFWMCHFFFSHRVPWLSASSGRAINLPPSKCGVCFLAIAILYYDDITYNMNVFGRETLCMKL